MKPDDLLNARIHNLLADDLDATAEAMHASRLLVTSAAVYWFSTKLSASERAEVLGEYVKKLAMAGEKDQKGSKR